LERVLAVELAAQATVKLLALALAALQRLVLIFPPQEL
jgi:hypothetical protein